MKRCPGITYRSLPCSLVLAVLLVAADDVRAAEELGKITKIDTRTRTIEYIAPDAKGAVGKTVQIPIDLRVYAIRAIKNGRDKQRLIEFKDLRIGDPILLLLPDTKVDGKKGTAAGPPVGLFRLDGDLK